MEEVLALYRERFSETLEKIQAFKERVLRRWQQFLDFLVPTYLLIGLTLSTISTVFIWYCGFFCHSWILGTGNMNYGVWAFEGPRAKLKLLDHGVDVSAYSTLPTSFFAYCGIDVIKQLDDPWCGYKTQLAQFFTIVTIFASTTSYICVGLAATNRKFPSWDGTGITCTYPFAIMALLGQIWSTLFSLLLSYFVYVDLADEAPVDLGLNYYLLASSILVAIFTLLYWKKTNRFELAKRSGKYYDPFILSAKRGDLDLLLEGIAMGVDINAPGSDGRNALHWACTLNRSTSCHILLRKGAEISRKDSEGWAPLHWASRMGNADIVRVLAKYGADVNAKDMWGTTPLMLSIIGGSRGATEVLLDLGAHVDARNVFGQTSIMLCAEEGHTRRDFAVLLTNAGASLERADAQGSNAVHYAASAGDKYMLQTVLECSSGGLHLKMNKYGATPLDEAILAHSRASASLLRHWGHDSDVETDGSGYSSPEVSDSTEVESDSDFSSAESGSESDESD